MDHLPPSELDRITGIVGTLYRKHVNDPNLIPQSAILAGTIHQLDRSRQYQEPDPKEVLRAANEAWTRIRTVERISKHDSAELRQKIAARDLKVWILTGAVVAQCGVIGWLATQLFARIH